jgi:RimJ/RimL family protein N-acetyltransferase
VARSRGAAWATMPDVMTQQPAPTELRTDRLLLRPPRMDDVDAYFALESDAEYAHYGSRRSIDRAGMERGLARIIDAAWPGSSTRPGTSALSLPSSWKARSSGESCWMWIAIT